jgi:hypothetical protein
VIFRLSVIEFKSIEDLVKQACDVLELDPPPLTVKHIEIVGLTIVSLADGPGIHPLFAYQGLSLSVSSTHADDGPRTLAELSGLDPEDKSFRLGGLWLDRSMFVGEGVLRGRTAEHGPSLALFYTSGQHLSLQPVRGEVKVQGGIIIP